MQRIECFKMLRSNDAIYGMVGLLSNKQTETYLIAAGVKEIF